MKAIKIIISIAIINILFVAGIAYFPSLSDSNINNDNSKTSAIDTQNIPKELDNEMEFENEDDNDAEPSTKAVQAPIQPTAKTPSPAPSSNQCIITISGIKYDVQPLRNTHSGGDVFTCNTDMTATFFGQHGQSLLNSTMQKYRLP